MSSFFSYAISLRIAWAQQARQMIQDLDDNIAIMRVQIETRIDGGYLPFADTLPPPADEEGDEA